MANKQFAEEMEKDPQVYLKQCYDRCKELSSCLAASIKLEGLKQPASESF